ncbi:MAG: CBS domain-containing protein [Fusobacteriota bacterium]
MKKVEDVMNKEVTTVKEDTSFDEILKIMQDKGFGKIPVMKDEKVVGVITRDDILIKEEKAPLPPVIAFWDLLITMPNNKEFKNKIKKISGFTAKEIMHEDFFQIKKDETVEDLVTKIIEEEYEYALVIDNKKLIGIVTKSDLINKSF